MSPARSPSPTPASDVDLDDRAGAVTVLRASARLLPRLPGVVVAYVVAALVTLASQDLANLLSIPVNAYAVTAAYRELGGVPADGNSVGVRVLLAFVAALVAGVATLVGFVLLVVPGLYLLVTLRLTVAAVMLDDAGPVAALGRSYDLTSSHLLTVAGVAAFPLGVLVVVTGGVAVAMGGFPASLATPEGLAWLRSTLRIAGAVGTLLADPVAVTANALLFAMYERGGDREEAWDDWDST